MTVDLYPNDVTRSGGLPLLNEVEHVVARSIEHSELFSLKFTLAAVLALVVFRWCYYSAAIGAAGVISGEAVQMQKRSVVAGSIAMATAGSAMFGGIALAGGEGCGGCGEGHGGGEHHSSSEGGNGTGGTATNNCLNVGIPILSGLGILGQGKADGASCTATANGTGGNATSGADY
ncbi:MAG: hypothetical protein M3Z25_11815 [Actinomycetota bacterium]|nr:hypothetical protein [Actinomycetota bacterium]